MSAQNSGGGFGNLPIIKQVRQSVGLQRFMLISGISISVFYILLALLAPIVSPYQFSQITYSEGEKAGQTFGTLLPPSAEHIWGTTVGGFDVLSRVIYGAQTALLAIVAAVLASIIIGVILGLLSGYFGGVIDSVLVVVADAIYSFPSLLLAILLAIIMNSSGGSVINGILAAGISITVVFIPQYFRVVRAEVLKVRNEMFVESAKIVGVKTRKILSKHVLRNSIRTLPVIITLNASEAILTLAALGFLGLGIEQTAAAEWGYDLNRSMSDVTSGIWWTGLFPGVAIILIVMGITLFGEGLNDLSDPRLRIRRKPNEFNN